jgi:hypothetical protein
MQPHFDDFNLQLDIFDILAIAVYPLWPTQRLQSLVFLTMEWPPLKRFPCLDGNEYGDTV